MESDDCLADAGAVGLMKSQHYMACATSSWLSCVIAASLVFETKVSYCMAVVPEVGVHTEKREGVYYSDTSKCIDSPLLPALCVSHQRRLDLIHQTGENGSTTELSVTLIGGVLLRRFKHRLRYNSRVYKLVSLVAASVDRSSFDR